PHAEGLDGNPFVAAGADDGAVLDGPELVDQAFPAGEVLAVEERILVASLGGREGEHEAQCEKPNATFHESLRKNVGSFFQSLKRQRRMQSSSLTLQALIWIRGAGGPERR